ncbi:MAG: TOBE domain-containing protein [Gammaproteobacteria bacterium]|nr:TOBE domain-containing protein [Gammaproteobacteria bacterium]
MTGSGTVFDTSSSLEVARDGSADPAAVVECLVTGYDKEYELAELALDEASLFVARGPARSRARPAYVYRARDVSIALSRAPDSSILNILPAVVDAIDSGADHHSVLVKLDTGGQPLLASVTRRSAATLDLAPGREVFAQVKGVALMTDHG